MLDKVTGALRGPNQVMQVKMRDAPIHKACVDAGNFQLSLINQHGVYRTGLPRCRREPWLDDDDPTWV